MKQMNTKFVNIIHLKRLYSEEKIEWKFSVQNKFQKLLNVSVYLTFFGKSTSMTDKQYKFYI